MSAFYWKWIWWFFRICVMIWFLLLPVLPIYGWLSPWPEAAQMLEAEGVRGVMLMIGSGGSSERDGRFWLDEKERTFIVLPTSLRRMEVFTCVESKGSEIIGVDRKVIRGHWLIQIILLWILAGWFSFKTSLLLINKLKGQASSNLPGM